MSIKTPAHRAREISPPTDACQFMGALLDEGETLAGATLHAQSRGATFVAKKILRHFCKWTKVTMVFTIVIFMDTCYPPETSVHYGGDYHV